MSHVVTTAASTVLLLGVVFAPGHAPSAPPLAAPDRPSCATLGVGAATFASIDRDLASTDSIWGGTGSARSAECVRHTVDGRGVVLVAVAGADERTGGIAVVDARTTELLAVWPYAAARELTVLAPGRVLLTYTPVRELLGAGTYESRYVVLCALAPESWVPCFDVPKDRVTRVMGGPVLRSLEEHNRLTVVGGKLQLTRRLRTSSGDARPQERQLAPSTLAIP